MRKSEARRYLQSFIENDIVQSFANEGNKPNFPVPDLVFAKIILPKSYAAYADGWEKIVLAEWVLSDKKEATGTIRHEVAHCLQYWLGYKIGHGKDFQYILQSIAPGTWEKDLGWHFSRKILKARARIGIRPPVFSSDERM